MPRCCKGNYPSGNPAAEAEKYREILKFIHLKDVDSKVMAEVRRSQMNFEQAIAANAFTIIGRGQSISPDSSPCLDKNGYSGWMVVEQDVTYGATVVPSVESVAASLRYLQQVSSAFEGSKAV
jgi:sugar phosphate isomerase/epimerase